MKEEKKKTFIIDEDVVKEVRKVLQAYIDHIDEDCTRSGCMCDLRGEVCSQRIRNTLHNFDSSCALVKRSIRHEEMKKEIEEMEEEITRLNTEIHDLTLDLRDCLDRERRG